MTIVKIDIPAQLKSIGAVLCIVFPGLGHIGNNLILPIVRHQPGKQEQVDFPMLIEGWVDGSIIPASIDEDFRRLFGKGRGLLFRASRRPHGENQRQQQHRRLFYRFSHKCILLFGIAMP